ncbi:unnamed protein product [Phyllotreta striolata]|uniref:Chitin-binding type-2 domain-containing protein n=1 Tax=Phyllotreta striolata TaxID=444603 RepID=A0A9N9TC04_PHYSR|nr:unnamed protein product [Phyllotreta striolata]
MRCAMRIGKAEATGGVISAERKFRNAPIATSIKTGVNFDCPEEFGYYPHPSDCTQYYVCVFGGALLESCTGGLMYSHELQTCDWPRNVGCDGLDAPGSSTSFSYNTPSRGKERTREKENVRDEQRSKYSPPPPPPPPAQPAAVVTSRGQPRNLHQNQQEIIKRKQQQQLYADAEETLPPAEEIENDRQQRVYRGQPSTIGQVQRDRDGLRHSNAISSYSGRGEKIGVISFGTQNQHYRSTDNNTVLKYLTSNKRRQKRQIRKSAPISNNEEEFHPFTPSYQKSSNYQYIAFGKYADEPRTSTSRYVDDYTNLRSNDGNRYSIKYKPSPIIIMQAETEKLLSSTPNQSIKTNKSSQLTQAIVSPYTEITSTTEPLQNNLKESKTNETTNNKAVVNEAPTEHFMSSSNFNPFANPNFDFEEFLKRYEEFITTTEKQTTSKPPTTTVTSPSPNTYRYPDESDKHRNIFDASNYVYKNLGNGSVLVIPKTETYQTLGCSTNKSMCSQDIKQEPKPYSKVRPAVKINQLNNSNDYYYYYYEDESIPEDKRNNKDYIYYYDDEYYYPDIDLNKKTNSTPVPHTKSTTEFPQIITTSSSSTTARQKTTSENNSTPRSSRGSASRKKIEEMSRPQTTTQSNSVNTKRPHRKINRSEEKTVAPQQASVSAVTAPARNIYNASQYNDNRYEPYYALYEDDVEIYRDEYPANENNYNSNNQHGTSTAYRGTSPISTVTTASVRNEIPRRGNTVYIENNINHQDIYQPSTASDYADNNKYDNQADDQGSYKQSNRQSYRGDRNELNDVEEVTTKRSTKRTTTSTTTTTRKPTSTTTFTTTTQRTIHLKTSSQTPTSTRPDPTDQNQSIAETVLNAIPSNYQQSYDKYEPFPPTYLETPDDSINTPNVTFVIFDSYPDSQQIVVKNVSETNFNEPIPTTNRPAYHYVTKASPTSTTTSATTSTTTTQIPDENLSRSNSVNRYPSLTQVITPTTYSPFRFVLKAPIAKPVLIETTPISNNWKSNSNPLVYQNTQSNNLKAYKALKAVRKVLNPVSLNYELSPSNAQDLSEEEPVKLKYIASDVRINNDKFVPTNTRFVNKKLPSYHKITTSTETTTSTEITSPSIRTDNDSKDAEENHSKEVELGSTETYSNTKTTKRPRQDHFSKQEPKPFSKPIITTTTKANFLHNDSNPTRASRVNAGIKSLISLGETRGFNKNKEGVIFPSKNYSNKRTPSRGRGSVQYSGAGDQITNNEVIVTNNRGTPPTRSRPTLKPSTSIVSKAQEYVDVYRYPPRRPDPIYPQPQVDKTAAKCRKDVCLLPDCSCGGKEIPGDLPVEQVPQMVLLTFDDSVNDLNKGLYQDLFEKGRTNPNGCPIAATFYVSHEWTDYSQVQNLYSDGHELASHTVSHSFGEQFSQKKWTREVSGQREILAAYGGVHLEDVRGMRAPFLSVGGNKMFKMLYDSNFTYDSSMPIYENKPPSWPYTLDYKLFHDCMIPPCPTRSYPGVWEVPMVMWQDLNGGRCSMGDACSNPPDADGVYKMLLKNFMRHYTTNRAPFGLFYHAAWFTQPHHKEGFINFIDTILAKNDVWFMTNWQAIQWVRDPTPISRIGSFQPFQCNYQDRPKRCNNPKVCNLWHKSGVRYMKTCQPCPDIYPWTGNTGVKSSKIDNDIGD